MTTTAVPAFVCVRSAFVISGASSKAGHVASCDAGPARTVAGMISGSFLCFEISDRISPSSRPVIREILSLCADVLSCGDPEGDRLEHLRAATRRIAAESENAALGWLVTNLESMCAVRVQLQPKGRLSQKFLRTLDFDIKVSMRALWPWV